MTSPVDVTLDVSSVPENPMGAGRYVVELARHLTAATDVLLTVIARQDDRERWSSMPGTAEVLDIVPKSRPARLIWEQMKLPSVINALAPGYITRRITRWPSAPRCRQLSRFTT